MNKEVVANIVKNTNKNIIALSLFILLSISVTAQVDSIPPDVRPFILKGYEPLDYIGKDLNGDKKQDAILVLKNPLEDSILEEEPARPLLILIRQSDGKLKQVVRNDNAIMCRHCGGVFGDPYEGINVHSKGFSLHFYGGSSWRWGYEYQFVYRPIKKNWYLVSEKEISFQSGDPEETMKEITIQETELGEIPISKFSTAYKYEEVKWKVIAPKTYFYDNPRLGTAARKGYLIKGNTATGIRELKNFVLVSYTNDKDEVSTGFILKKDLLKITK